MLHILGKLKNKANSYEVRINPSLWNRIKPIVEHWRKETKKSPWWIAPSGEVKAFEEEVAWRFRSAEKREFLNGEQLELRITLINQPHDSDAIKAIPDAIQKSGRITNDKQIRKLIIEHEDGKKPAIEISLKLF